MVFYARGGSKTKLIVLAVALAVIISSNGVFAQETAVWVVESAKIRCVFENISVYLASKNDPVIVYLDACPETDMVAVFREMTKNSTIPTIRRRDKAPNEPEQVIVFTKAELECLSRHMPDTTNTLTRLPRKPCEVAK